VSGTLLHARPLAHSHDVSRCPDPGRGGLQFEAGSPSGDGGAPRLGGPGCGLDPAAFRDTFDAPATTLGRAGELDPARWSGSRFEVQLATAGGQPFPILPGGVSACRRDTPTLVFPDQDALVCDANAAIGSSHLLVSVSSQNYGENSYRIRQPFDFAGRTGKIVFDREAFTRSLLGWIAVEITEDPTAAPSFAIRSNYEGAAIPQNALEIQFADSCGADWLSTSSTGSFGVDSVHVLYDYVDTVASPATPTCIGTQQVFCRGSPGGTTSGSTAQSSRRRGSMKCPTPSYRSPARHSASPRSRRAR
jgi:hypothetical protein